MLWAGRPESNTLRDSFSSVRQSADHGNAQENPREKQESRHDRHVHFVLQSGGCIAPEGSISPQPIRNPVRLGEVGAITVPAAARDTGHGMRRAQLLAVAGKGEARERRTVSDAQVRVGLRPLIGGCETIHRRRKSDPGNLSSNWARPVRKGRSGRAVRTIHRRVGVHACPLSADRAESTSVRDQSRSRGASR